MIVFFVLLVILEFVCVYALLIYNVVMLYATELAMVLLIKSYDKEFRERILENYPPIEPLRYSYIEQRLEEDLY